MNHDDDRGEERLVAMAVAEAAGRGPDDLEQRVLQRLSAEAQVPHRARRAWLAAAALLMVGTAVVVGVAVTARRGDDASAVAAGQGSQDPQPGKPEASAPKITNANLPKFALHMWTETPAIDCIEKIALDAKFPFASAVIEKPVTLKLTGVTSRQALAAFAAAADAHLEQHGAVLAVVPGVAPAEGTVTLQRGPTPIHELLELVGQQAHLDLVVAGAVTGQVAVDVKDCPGRDLVALLVDAVGAEVVGRGRVLAIVPKSEVPLIPVHFAFARSDVSGVLIAVARITGVAVQGGETIAGKVSIRVTGKLRPLDVVQAIAATQGCVIGRLDGKPCWRKADADQAAFGRQRVGHERGAWELERLFTFVAAPRNFTTQHQLEGTAWLFVTAAPRAHVLAALGAVAGGQVEPRENGGFEFVR